MTTNPQHMARPGYTIRVSAPEGLAFTTVEQALATKDFSRKTPKGVLPAEYSHGSTGVTLLSDVVSEVVPIAFLPWFRKKRKTMTVRVRVLESAGAACVLRIDMRPHELRMLTVPYFEETVEAAVAAFRAGDVAVDIEGPTDSALEGKR